jgi:hypothetical protein
MKYIAATCLLSVGLTIGGCANRFAVTRIQEIPKTPTVKSDTLQYNLPRTVVTAQVTVTKMTKEPGVFAPWADLFLAALGAKPDDVIRQEKVGIKVKSAAISQSSEPDPDQVYSMAVKATAWEQLWQDRNGTMKFNSQGVLTSGLITVTNTAPDTILSLASLASGVVNRTVLAPVGGGGPGAAAVHNQCATRATPEEETILDDFSKVAYLPKPEDDQTTFCQLRNPNWGNSLEELKKKAPFYEASVEAAAKDLTQVAVLRQALAEYRSMMATIQSLPGAIQVAQAPKDVQTALNAILQSEREDYLGSSSPEDWTPAFIYRPPSRPPQASGVPVAPVSLFSYDPGQGICTVDDSQQREGIQIPDNWKVDKCASPRQVTLQVACPQGVSPSGNGCDDLAQRSGLAVKPATGVRGFPYRLPAPRLIQILDGDKEKGRAGATIAQLGPVLTLPSSLGGFSTDYDAEFDESTGALASIKFGSKAAVNKDTVDSASTLVTGTIDARQKQLASVKARADTAAQSNSVGGELDRRKTLLQSQADYLAACAAAGLQCPLLVGPDGKPISQ